MTPLQINMMLHYFCSPEPYALREPAHAQSPAVASQRFQLFRLGLLVPDAGPSGWRPTELGKEYIEQLKAMDPKGITKT